MPYALTLVGLILFVLAPGLAGGLLGAFLFLAGAWRAPVAGLAGVAAALPFQLMPRQFGGLAIAPSEAALVLAWCALSARRLREWRGGVQAPRFPDGQYDGPMALFLASALLSLLATEYLRLSLRELRTIVVEPAIYYYLLRGTVRTTRQAWLVVGALLASAALVGSIGIAQFFVGGAVTEVQGVRRVQGTYLSPNHLALLLGRCIPFALAAAWLRAPSRLLAAPALAIYGAALLLTFSLGGWLATLAAATLVLALAVGLRASAWIAAGCLALLAIALSTFRVERLASHFDTSQGTALVRLQLWLASLGMLRDHPWLGIGMDNFLYRYPEYLPGGTVLEPNLSHPHNLILHVWLQLGVVGLVAMLWMLARYARSIAAAPRREKDAARRALVIGGAGSMADFVLHGLVDNSYFLADMAFIFWLTLAVASGPTDRKESDRAADPAMPAGTN